MRDYSQDIILLPPCIGYYDNGTVTTFYEMPTGKVVHVANTGVTITSMGHTGSTQHLSIDGVHYVYEFSASYSSVFRDFVNCEEG